jgi:hypothetical protein
MKMVAHQAIRVDLPTCLRTRLAQRLEKEPPILIILTNVFPPVPAVQHVIDRSRILEA